jgi:hypothetical protein
LLVVALILLVPLAHRSRSAAKFAEPTDCLCAYYEACQNGDMSAYLRCLTPRLRSKIEGEAQAPRLGTVLRQGTVKNWVVVSASDDQSRVSTILIDEVRPDGISRVRFQLERAGNTWLIENLSPVQQNQPSIPFGTDVRAVLGKHPAPEDSPEPDSVDLNPNATDH